MEDAIVLDDCKVTRTDACCPVADYVVAKFAATCQPCSSTCNLVTRNQRVHARRDGCLTHIGVGIVLHRGAISE